MCTVCAEVDSIRDRVASLSLPHGAVAQSGRAPAWHAGGSWVQIPSAPLSVATSTTYRAVGLALGGLVAGEGSYTTKAEGRYQDGSPRKRFVFQLTMAERDRSMVTALRNYLGFGSVRSIGRRNPRWQGQVVLTVNSFRAHHASTIPFGEAFLLPSRKRDQFEAWRDEMLEYERVHNVKVGRSTCAVPDCEGLVRGRGLCRHHYYLETGY